MYDCNTPDLPGHSIRCWRKNERSENQTHTTDVDCLWENWRGAGVVNDAYYYFTEVGAEVNETSDGRFKLNNINMQRVAGGGQGSSNNYVYIKNKATNVYMRPDNTNDNASIWCGSNDNSNWFKWEKVSTSGGYFYLKNVQTGKYFRPQNGNDGSLMQQKNTGWNGTWTQWREVTSGDGNSVHLQNRATGKYIRPKSSSNTNIELRPSSWSGNWTRFYMESAGSRKGTTIENVIETKPFTAYIASSQLSVSGQQMSSATLYGLNGKIYWQTKNSSTEYNADLSNLQKGIYVLKALTISGEAKTQKLVLR